MNGKQFAGSTYIEHAKHYKEQYEKPHQKQYQEHIQTMAKHQKPTQWAPSATDPWSTAGGSVTFSKENNETPLTESELDYFFWKTLIPLGWRKNQGERLAESYQLMLVCEECDRAIVSQQSHTITLGKAKKMSDKVKVNEDKKTHKAKCKPLEYDEDGNLVEAIPEATPFNPFVVGDVRYDTIDGKTKIFTSNGWVSVVERQETGFDISPEVLGMLSKNMNNYLDTN
jgi:hypothetical protein